MARATSSACRARVVRSASLRPGGGRCCTAGPRQGRHGVDADFFGAGADDVGSRPRLILWRAGALEEHAVGADAGVHDRRGGGDRVGRLGVQHDFHRRQSVCRRAVESVLAGRHHQLARGDFLERRLHPRIYLHRVPDDVRLHHPGADRRRVCRAHPLPPADAVHRAVADDRLFPDRAYGLVLGWSRFPPQAAGRLRLALWLGDARFRRRYRGPHQRRHCRTDRVPRDRQAHRLQV